MADLDELQIKISSSSKDAEKAIDTLIDGLERLNSTLSKLDVSKVNSFANSMQKLANIGSNTNTTAKALKGIANEISSSFGIRTKKGVEDVTTAIQALYNSARNLKLNDSPENQNVYFNTIKGLQKAIEANYKYKEAVDDTTKSIADYVKAQNTSGQKIAMGDMAKEYGENFQQIAKVLGKSFNNKLLSTQDATDLAKFFEDMNAALNTSFKTGNDQELKQSLDDLVHILENAKDKVYDFSDAVSSGLLSGEEAANAAYNIADRLFALINEQDKYGASSGLGGLVEVFKQISNIQMPDMTGTADVLNAVQASTSGMGETAPKVENVAESIGDISESASKALPSVVSLQTALEKISVDSTGEWVDADDFIDPGEMKQTEAAINKVADAAENAKEKINAKPVNSHVFADVLSEFQELSEAFEKISHKFGEISEKGIKLFEVLVSPLKHVAEEYAEKFEGMKASVNDFVKTTQAKLKKLSDFWKRTMRTFTFMIVRKAITAIMTETNNAIQSLAMFSNQIGTQFNTSISNLVADFQYLGRSIVSIFAPLLDIIAPIIDAIVAKIATLLSYIGMFFAAIGGKTSFTKAKRNVGNYAESLDNASKKAKNLTMGIDELNIIAEESGSSSQHPWDGFGDAWEEVPIPDWIFDLLDKLKKLLADLFEPIKRAWDLAKDYVLDGWKFMIENLKKLLADVWRDFLRVWKSDIVTHIFYNLFMILGDILRVIGFIAKRFDEAWNEAEKGYYILKNIAQIVDILVQHLRNVTLYMVGWASRLNFNPLLSSVLLLTAALKDLAEFLGGVFEDVMKNVVLKYIDFLIREGIPHLLSTIANVIAAFDLEAIRAKLVPIEKAFEELLEAIDVGVTNALGNLGMMLADFTESEAFDNLLNTIEHMLTVIDAEDVEKILTGIGTGILSIANALARFVGSESFNAFLDSIDQWLQNATAEDIANILENIAIAIGLFKFGEFATAGLAGFFAFASIIKSFQDISAISANLTAVATQLGAIGSSGAAAGAGSAAAATGLSAIAAPAAIAAAVIMVVVEAAYSLVNSFGGLDGLLTELRRRFSEMKTVADNLAKALKMDESINKLKDAFHKLGAKLGDLKDLWTLLFDVVQFFASAVLLVVEPAIKILIDVFTVLVDVCASAIDAIGGLATVVKGFFDGITSGDWSGAWDTMKQGVSRVKDAIIEGISPLGSEVNEKVSTGIVEGINQVPDTIAGDVQRAYKRVAGVQSENYSTEIAALEGIAAARNQEVLTNAANSAAENVDYSSASKQTVNKWFSSYQQSIGETDFDALGRQWNEQSGGTLISNSAIFEDKNKLVANEGAAAFSQEYRDFLTNNTELSSALETTGSEYAGSLVESFNSKIQEDMQTTQPFLEQWFKYIDESIHNNSSMPYGSPNIKAQEYGKDMVLGFNLGITANAATSNTAISTWFAQVNATLRNEINKIKTTFNTLIVTVFSGQGADVTGAITTLFTNVTTLFMTNLELLGTTLLGTLLPTFMQTYIFPFFDLEMWQPILDNLMNAVFIPNFELFTTWFTESMTVWWEDGLLFWFTDDKWNEDVFTPLANNIHEHWNTFSVWWDTTMNAWWNNQVKPWFLKDKWIGEFNHILEAARETFEQIKNVILEKMKEAEAGVIESCNTMKAAIQDVIAAIGEMMDAMSAFEGFQGEVTFAFGAGKFAAGGYPSRGSLFWAGEAGPELLGTVGGKTAVASNDEITGIASAVYSTGNEEAQLLSQLISIGQAMLNKDPVVISDKDIARMNNSGQSKLGLSIIS